MVAGWHDRDVPPAVLAAYGSAFGEPAGRIHRAGTESATNSHGLIDGVDGTCIRDYVHVHDLAAAHVAALSACRPREFTAYNLGQGKGSSIREVIDYAQRITKRSINATVEQRRAGDPRRPVADAALARTNLAWTPVHSSLENVIPTAWKWMTESGGRSMKTAWRPISPGGRTISNAAQ